jgi:hypothetical protein
MELRCALHIPWHTLTTAMKRYCLVPEGTTPSGRSHSMCDRFNQALMLAAADPPLPRIADP